MKAFIGVIIGVASALALFAFAAWDLNPGNWGNELRSVSVIFIAAGAIIGGVIGGAVQI
jgi:hypothetical protein